MICGLMTPLGGIFHTLPYLIPAFLHSHRRGPAIVVGRIVR